MNTYDSDAPDPRAVAAPPDKAAHRGGGLGPNQPVYDWLKSEYGGEVHGFKLAVGDYREALCEHTAPVAKLHPFIGSDPKCVRCLLAYGDEIEPGQEWRNS